jgi:hypothetical protein
MKIVRIKYISKGGSWLGDCDAYSPLPKKGDIENINLINYVVVDTKRVKDTLNVIVQMKDNLKRFDFIREAWK